jgi:hypothetical protein
MTSSCPRQATWMPSRSSGPGQEDRFLGQAARLPIDLEWETGAGSPDTTLIATWSVTCSNRVVSSWRISEAPSEHRDATVANAAAQQLRPGTAGTFASSEAMPQRWRWLRHDLAERCGLSEQELLGTWSPLARDMVAARSRLATTASGQQAQPTGCERPPWLSAAT